MNDGLDSYKPCRSYYVLTHEGSQKKVSAQPFWV